MTRRRMAKRLASSCTATGSRKACSQIRIYEQKTSGMVKVFTGIQFVCSLLFTLLVWLAPNIGWIECGSPAMIHALSMADFMWLLTLVLVCISLAKHEKERINNETEGTRNY